MERVMGAMFLGALFFLILSFANPLFLIPAFALIVVPSVMGILYLVSTYPPDQ